MAKAIKFVKKDCGIHSGPVKGPCAKCSRANNLRPSSIAAALEGTVTLSSGLKIETTATNRI